VCTRCANRFEVFQKINDSPLEKCRKCGGELRKIISPPALQFKGNGWYITDYARKPSLDKSDKEEKPQAKTAGVKSGSDKGSAEAEKPSKTED
ncbi:MAG: zinc ribbon domain-containing protein, partial [Candidatus Aminicenantes bacterium]|nr:zinc ribbon domain-containing protein [Candidatus Aminicenantes bacterium]